MANKNYEIIISENAAKMLLTHVRFLANVDISSAKRLHAEIVSAIKSLKNLPDRYPWLTDNMIPANKYRKMPVAKQYLLIYQIKENSVYVDYIADCRQDYKWLTK